MVTFFARSANLRVEIVSKALEIEGEMVAMRPKGETEKGPIENISFKPTIDDNKQKRNLHRNFSKPDA